MLPVWSGVMDRQCRIFGDVYVGQAVDAVAECGVPRSEDIPGYRATRVEDPDGRYVEVDIDAAALKARIVLIGALAGASAQLLVLAVMGKRLTIAGTMLGARATKRRRPPRLRRSR